MLVLTRKLGEDLLIFPDGDIEGRKITISVSACRSDRTTFNMDAPKGVIILRREAYERQLREMEELRQRETKPEAI